MFFHLSRDGSAEEVRGNDETGRQGKDGKK